MTLRDYQKEIVRKAYAILKDHLIVYLSMEVRTGKTLTALSIAKVWGAGRVLFVTKKKARSSIIADFKKVRYNYFLKIVNYEALHKVKGNFDFVIIDEAHSLGAYPKPSLRTKRLKEIVDRKPLVLMSGTPSPESYSQLYHQFWIHDNSPFIFYKNFYKWAKVFVKVRERMINGYKINDYSNADKKKIDEMVKHLFISFSQKDAGFTNEVEEEVVDVEINPNIYKLAERLLKDRYYQFKDGTEVVCDTAAKLKTKLHQVFSGTVITEEGILKTLDTSKAEYIKEKYRGQKIAIFYLYRAEEIILKRTFPNWTESPEEFNSSFDRVFISQIQSGSMGTNLSTADVIIFYNIHYSSLLYWQARARSQDKNRVDNSKVVWIFSEKGIEKDIYKAVVKKKDYTTSYFRRSYLG